jgi:hypothetical protein
MSQQPFEAVDEPPITTISPDGVGERDYADMPSTALLIAASEGDAVAWDTLQARGQAAK